MANFAYSKTVNKTLGMSSGVGGTDLTRSQKNEILCLFLTTIKYSLFSDAGQFPVNFKHSRARWDNDDSMASAFKIAINMVPPNC